MFKTNLITHFQKLSLQFITEQDPLLAMLQWLTEQLMQLESEEQIEEIEENHSVLDFDTTLLICHFLDIEVNWGWLRLNTEIANIE